MTADRRDLIPTAGATPRPPTGSSAGFTMAAGAYVLWGLLTLYWPLLEPASALEILAHRVVWSFALVVLIVTATRRWPRVVTIVTTPRLLALLAAAGVLVGGNWWSYIWAVNNAHVVDASLGYYINPLVSAALGVAVLRERLHAIQWCAIALAGAGVTWLFLDSGRPPWISLALAGTFALYGLAKKVASVGMLEGLVVENAVLCLPAVVFLLGLGSVGLGRFGTGWLPTVLLVSTGLATMAPLMLFGSAVTTVSLTSIGMLQFLTPTLQFVIGRFGLHEDLGGAGVLPYVVVWFGVVAYVVGIVVRGRAAGAAA